jgi:hypothetical protein
MIEQLDEIITDLETRISAIESRTRARKEIDQERFVYAIRFLITELWKSIYTIPARKGVVQFNKNYYNSDYCDPNLKYQGVKDAFDNLYFLGLIKTETDMSGNPKFEKDYKAIHKRGKSTRFWVEPDSELYESLMAIQAQPAQIKRGSLDKRVILRERVGKDKINVNYTNTPQTMQWEANLACINDCLERHWADLKLTEAMIPAFLERLAGRRRDYNEDRAHFDLSKRTIGRVFAEGRFDRGGRFFGHWAQNIPNKVKEEGDIKYRELITIDGKSTVEYDYETLHPSMLYFLEDKEMGNEDAYSRVLGEEYRKPVKWAFNAMVNSKGNPTRPPRKFRVEDFGGLEWKDVVNKIMDAHKPIASMFYSNKGNELQFMDSQIAEAIMLEYSKQDYPVIPVHDSFIMHHGFGSTGELEETMRKAFYGVMGKQIDATEKVKLINALTDETNESVENIEWGDISFETIVEGDAELKSYNKRDYLWFANKNSNSAVQYMPDEILKPKNYKKYKDRQNS